MKTGNSLSCRKYQLKKRYGVSWDGYLALCAKAGNVCEICGDAGSIIGGRMADLNVDHCHVTGKIRGALCTRCNMGLGAFKDKPTLLRKAADYITSRS